MRTELMFSMLAFLSSAGVIRYMLIKQTSIKISKSKIIVRGLLGWIFLLSIAAWMVLFGDTFTAWLTHPVDGGFISIFTSLVVFLFVYILSFRPNAPYPGTDILDFALASLSFQEVTSVSTNKLIMFLRKRAFNKFLEEVQPDSQDQSIQQRENLIEHLHQEQTKQDGLKLLENGKEVDVIKVDTPRPPILSKHILFNHLVRLTIRPHERKAILQLEYPQIEECTQEDVPACTRFLRLAYDFIQAVSHEHFLKQYASFFDMLSLSVFQYQINAMENSEEPVFLFEISIASLRKLELTYINPLKLSTIANIRFRSENTQRNPMNANLVALTSDTTR